MMKPCISQATTLGSSFEADLAAFESGGWSAVEIWLTTLETCLATHSAADARALLARHRLSPAAAAAQGGLLLTSGTERAEHWNHFRRRLALLEELGVPLLIVVPDFIREPNLAEIERAA